MRTTTLDLLLVTALFAGLVYFSVDAIAGGPSGGWYLSDLEDQIDMRRSEIAVLNAERAQLLDKTARLSGPIIDRELLDEQLRSVFAVGHARDVLLIAPRDE